MQSRWRPTGGGRACESRELGSLGVDVGCWISLLLKRNTAAGRSDRCGGQPDGEHGTAALGVAGADRAAVGLGHGVNDREAQPAAAGGGAPGRAAVSYTHLTLPTIYSV